ncbi:hypothetical protein BGZ83_010223 [Gryganskiella cystojenkinii]|nr:hypothetical protein BGZ83_010223 [Gryganskiella cystojenkinii]
MKEFDPRISQEAIYQRDRLYGKTISSNSNNGESDQARVGHHYREHAQHATGGSSNYDARRPVQEDSVVTDLSMDNSLLEQRFRVKLDVAIPTNGPTRQGAEARTQHRNQYTHPGVANGPFQNISDNRDTYNTQNQHAEQLPSSPERRARDLYHSSYSPSEFSQTEDVVDVENSDQGAGNDEDDDQSNTTEIKASGTPTPTGPPALTTTHRPPPSSTVLNPTPTTNNTGHVINVTSTQMNPRPTGNRPHNDPKYDDGEISFQREVARARAKRELSQSVQHQIAAPGGQPFYNHDNGREITGAQSLKTTSNVRKLDHGRDLAIEDLASPTHYGFDNRESSADEGGRAQRQNRGDGPAGTSRFSLLGAATDLAKMDIITEKEDMFMELAEDLGEGQAVASVLGTLKGMIRQLKIEKRTSQRAIKKLQKDLKQSQRELERTRKAKEKLAAAKAKRTATHPSSALDSVDIMKNPPRSSNTPRRTVEEQKTAILVEQQENEARGAAAVIGKQKDLIERNLATLQNRIDALERQKDAVRKRDLRRAEEEADLLLLIKTDSEDEDEDDESSSSSEDESDLDDEDQEQGEEEVEEEEEREDLRSTVRYIGPSNKEAKGHHGTAEHDMRHSQRRPQKDILSNGASSQRSTRVPLDVTESSKAQKKGSVSKSLRTKSDHPEEVHVHHHVHYEDEEILELLGVHSKSRGAASGGHSPRVPFARSLASTTSRLGKLSEESEDQTAEVHRVNLGTGFRSSRRGSQTEGSDDIHRVRPSSSTTAVHEVYPQRQVQLAGQTLLSRVRGEEAELTSATARLRFKDDDEEGSGKKSSVVVSGPQKKISINKARIMALLKNHNPKRCTVCCDGGTDGQHCTRHRYHEHKTITTTSAASSTNGTSGSQDLDRHRHRQEGLTVGATSSVRFEKSLSSPSRSPLHVQALLSMDNSEKDDSESDDNATAHGSQRRGDVNFKGRVEIDGGASSSVTTAAMSQTKTNGKSQPRSSSGETKNKTGKQPASTTRTVDEQKQQPQSVVGVLQLQTELSQLQDEILSLRKSFVKRTAPVSASTSASATTAPISNETPTQTSSASATASTSKAAVPSAI